MTDDGVLRPTTIGSSALDLTPEDHDDVIDDVIEDFPSDLDHGDGRTRRRQRNRNAVIAALIALIQEGDLEPNVAKIADRAGVSHRSIFRYFEDLDDLARTAVETEFRNVQPDSEIPEIGLGSLEHRVNELTSAHIRTYQRTHSLGRVARSRVITIPEIDNALALINGYRTEQVRLQFAPEIKQLDKARGDALVIAAAVLLSFESFDVQRRSFDLSIEEVRNVWRTGLLALLS